MTNSEHTFKVNKTEAGVYNVLVNNNQILHHLTKNELQNLNNAVSKEIGYNEGLLTSKQDLSDYFTNPPTVHPGSQLNHDTLIDWYKNNCEGDMGGVPSGSLIFRITPNTEYKLGEDFIHVRGYYYQIQRKRPSDGKWETVVDKKFSEEVLTDPNSYVDQSNDDYLIDEDEDWSLSMSRLRVRAKVAVVNVDPAHTDEGSISTMTNPYEGPWTRWSPSYKVYYWDSSVYGTQTVVKSGRSRKCLIFRQLYRNDKRSWTSISSKCKNGILISMNMFFVDFEKRGSKYNMYINEKPILLELEREELAIIKKSIEKELASKKTNRTV